MNPVPELYFNLRMNLLFSSVSSICCRLGGEQHHGCGCLYGCDAEYWGRNLLTFRKNALPSSQGSKSGENIGPEDGGSRLL
jgi:hypothetical protein